MADFGPAQDYVINVAEGGYKEINIPGDAGGRTYAGISYRANPLWEGWQELDNGMAEDDPRLIAMADALYEREYWNRVKGSEIASQRLATALYSCAVLHGVRTAVRLIQGVSGVKADGIMGPLTAAALHSENLAEFGLAQIDRYVRICERDRTQRQWFFGWCRRTLRETQC